LVEDNKPEYYIALRRSQKTISARGGSALGGKKGEPFQKKGFKKITPNLDELRRALEESLAEEKNGARQEEKIEEEKNSALDKNNVSKKGVLNPGENIKFE